VIPIEASRVRVRISREEAMGDVQERNKRLIRRWIAPARDGSGPFLLTDAARRLLAEDAVWHLPPSAEIPGVSEAGLVRGRDAIHGIQQRAREIYDVPTMRTQVRNLLADGDWVVLQYEMRCRAANGNELHQEYAFLFEVRDGLIVAIWDYYDTLAVDRIVLSRPR
jgi:ketosteroid isomerase-like protein